MTTTPEDAGKCSAEIASAVRATLDRYVLELVRSGELPDIGIMKLDAMCDKVSATVHKEVFPFLDGGVLPK